MGRDGAIVNTARERVQHRRVGLGARLRNRPFDMFAEVCAHIDRFDEHLGGFFLVDIPSEEVTPDHRPLAVSADVTARQAKQSRNDACRDQFGG